MLTKPHSTSISPYVLGYHLLHCFHTLMWEVFDKWQSVNVFHEQQEFSSIAREIKSIKIAVEAILGEIFGNSPVWMWQ